MMATFVDIFPEKDPHLNTVEIFISQYPPVHGNRKCHKGDKYFYRKIPPGF